MAYRQRLGSWGEKQAENFLCTKGFVLVERNVRSHFGEVDLVMKDGAITVFVEVKTRTNLDYGTPEESITRKKQERMRRSADELMQSHPEWGEDYRIDVVAVFGLRDDPAPEILWFENAVA